MLLFALPEPPMLRSRFSFALRGELRLANLATLCTVHKEGLILWGGPNMQTDSPWIYLSSLLLLAT